MEIEELKIVAPPGIICRYSRPKSDSKSDDGVLIVSFDGTYPPGSRGNEHGSYMAHMTIHGVAAFSPDCVLLDLRRLEYQWGNTLLLVFQEIDRFMNEPNEAPFPIVVVTGDSSREAVLSLFGGDGGDWHYTSLEAGVEAARAKGEAWLDA